MVAGGLFNYPVGSAYVFCRELNATWREPGASHQAYGGRRRHLRALRLPGRHRRLYDIRRRLPSRQLEGAVYVFQSYVFQSDDQGRSLSNYFGDDFFGKFLAIDGNELVIGALQTDDSGTESSGSVFVFQSDDGGLSWREIVQDDGDRGRATRNTPSAFPSPKCELLVLVNSLKQTQKTRHSSI